MTGRQKRITIAPLLSNLKTVSDQSAANDQKAADVKVHVEISGEITEPYFVLHANTMTEELQNAVSDLEQIDCTGQPDKFITVFDENMRIVVLQPDEIFLVRSEQSKTVVYCQTRKLVSKRRLFEIKAQLGESFVQISKSTLINLKHIDSVEPLFNSIMKLKMKNGLEDYISRTYLPAFKKHLGL